MLRRLEEYVKANDLVRKNDRVLLAISGGVDSVALAELFHQAGYRFGIAHCNFGLRGDESDADERFVEGLAKKYHVPYHTKRFLTAEDAKEHKVSIQMAARELRYQWFEEVRIAEGYDSVATGHHLDDEVETFFINLLRGTGIAGLHGILPKNGKVIRPMLFATRDEIAEFAHSAHIAYREDSSNHSKKYLRNRIRLELIPLLKEIQPGFVPLMSDNIYRFREAVEIYRRHVDAVRKKVLQKREGKILVSIADLKALQPECTWLFELFGPFGFNEAITEDMALALHHPGKKEFSSDGWIAIKDREQIILKRKSRKTKEGNQEEFKIDQGQTVVKKPVLIALAEIDNGPEVLIPEGKEFASLDMDKLEFPLVLRRWKAGDAFIPFGMEKKKKVSDFFIDSKVSAEAKENAWILWSGSRIAWIVGHRPDNRFRVTSRTRKILQVRLAGVLVHP